MNILEMAGVLTGLLYLWLEYRASIYLWPVSIVMPAIYTVVYFKAGLYADSRINIYYMLAAVYGWCMWCGKRGNSQKKRNITCMPLRFYALSALVGMLLFFPMGWLLASFTDSDVPWWDSLTTALSVVALWMLARKYVEQWLLWIVVDVLCCALYVYKELYPTAALYGLYAVIAVFGYMKWKKMMN